MRAMLSRLGPGLLYAGAAVGVSHLVQSTRAGATYGLWMILIVILANLLKLPFFKAGPVYTNLSGKSLLQGFHESGKGAMLLFYLVTLTTMFTVQAVVTLITASVVSYVFDLHFPLWQISAAILFVCGIILWVGHYQWLSNIMKAVIVLLSITTLVTLMASIGNVSNAESFEFSFSFLNSTDVFFLIALIGWMPAPFDIVLWHSEWTLEASKAAREKVSLKHINFDFKVGYWGTTALAVAFVALGSFLLKGNGSELPASGAAFAGEIIGMYTATLGNWAFVFVALAAFTTMFSTTLTVLDAYPRVMSKALHFSMPTTKALQSYNLWLIITILGALFVLVFQLENMKQLVDLATTVSFLTAPILASLIWWLVTKMKENPFRAWEKGLAYLGLVFLYCFSFYYLWESYV